MVEDVAERAAQRATSNAFAPASAFSSETVNSSSSPTGEPSTGSGAGSSSTATAALLSAPRMPSLAFSQPPSTSTGSTGAASATVSRCAHSSTLGASCAAARDPREQVAALRARRGGAVLVDLEAQRAQLGVTRSAHARSRPKGLSIRHSSAKVSFRRRRSASLAARLTGLGGARPGRVGTAAPHHDLGSASRARLCPRQRGADELAEQRRRAARAAT